MYFFLADTPVPSAPTPPIPTGFNFISLEEGNKIKCIFFIPEGFSGYGFILLSLPMSGQAARAKERSFHSYSTLNNFSENFALPQGDQIQVEISIDPSLWPPGSRVGCSCTLLTPEWVPGPTFYERNTYLSEPG
jgi:hypothetical protein